MADQLYLSLWYPNFRFEALPAALIGVLRQFALVAGNPEAKRISAAAAYPISFNEAPTFQRLYVNDERTAPSDDSLIENAVAEVTELLHEDTAYELEARWSLWTPELPGDSHLGLAPLWKEQLHTVRFLGFGPEFDDATFEQNGHIRIDFGLDTPWVPEPLDPDEALDDTPESHLNDEDDPNDESLSQLARQRIQQNVEKLLAFTLSVEKHCGISSRLLWTESGEPLAEKLIARLQRLN